MKLAEYQLLITTRYFLDSSEALLRGRLLRAPVSLQLADFSDCEVQRGSILTLDIYRVIQKIEEMNINCREVAMVITLLENIQILMEDDIIEEASCTLPNISRIEDLVDSSASDDMSTT